MAPIRETIRKSANHVVDVLKQKAQLRYQDGRLKLETNARVFKRFVENTAPYMVLTGLGKVRDSTMITVCMPTNFQQKHQTHRSTTAGRIKKRKHYITPAQRGFEWYDKMKREAAKMAHEKEMCLQEEQWKMVEEKRRRQQLRTSSDRWTPKRRVGIKDSCSQSTPPLPPSPYVPEKSPYSDKFYENQTPEERRKFINERLTNILGEERMKAPILLSGHNPIDPVIAEHNQRVITASIIDVFEVQRAEFQRQADEQMFMAHQENEAYVRTKVVYNHYIDIYRGRINRLAMYTGEMSDSIDLLDNALTNHNVWEVANAVQVLTHQIFEPIHSLLQECDNEVSLDLEGAQMLKDAWPMARLDELYEYMVSKADGLEAQAVHMAQFIEAIAQRINNPTPLVNPVEQKQQPINNLRANYGSSNANPTANFISAPESGAWIPSTVPAPEFRSSKSGRASTSSVDVDAHIPGAATSVSAESGISKLLAATSAKATGDQQAGSSAGSKVPSTTVEPEDSTAWQYVIQYIATDNMALETEIQDMFRNKEVKNSHRRAVKECINGLMDAANGAESILGTMDAGHYRGQIETCVTKIDALPLKIRQNKDIQALKKVCGCALRIWAIHE